MSPEQEAPLRRAELNSRRFFLRQCTLGLGGLALGGMLGCGKPSPGAVSSSVTHALATTPPHFAPRAKRVIYLHMAGAPSQLETFDFKPKLVELHGKPCPESLLEGKRFAFLQGTPTMLGPQARFSRYGKSGAWVSDLLPHFTTAVDEVAFLKAVRTDEFNHAPAQLLLHTGSPRLGRPGMGAWVTYGLGSANENLPSYIVLASGGRQPSAGKKLWGSGFLPGIHQGVQCRTQGDPILYLSDPGGVPRELRGGSIEAINRINQRQYEEVGDPETLTRIKQYEMAFRMQMSVPEVMDIKREPAYIHELYGTEPGRSSFANNCLLARRLVESGVRFVQLFHWGWDSHGTNEGTALEIGLRDRCREVDRPMTALLQDLKQRGLLEDTLVVWGGEFGRTPMQENRGGTVNPYLGRDHQADGFTMWMAGGGAKAGATYGVTDELGLGGVDERLHVHDVQATILHLLGMDHERLTYPFQGRDFRLTDVHGEVCRAVVG